MNPNYFKDDNPLKNWKDSLNLYENFAKLGRQWIFRGLPDANYKLATAFERMRTRFDTSSTDATAMEKQLVRVFRRQAHRYLEHPPKDDDTIQWLALMQHFGAPTRFA